MSAKQPKLGYAWHLRRLMAEQGMFATTDLQPHLAERGISLSSVQVCAARVMSPLDYDGCRHPITTDAAT